MENENQDQQQRKPRIPVGRYRGRAVSARLANSPEKNTPYVHVEFKIADEEFRGEHVTWMGYFTPASEDRTLESLRHCGWKTDDVDNLEGITDNEVELQVEHNTFEGKTFARVGFVNRIGGFQPKAPMNAEDAKSFAAKMRGKAAASRVKNGGSAVPASDVPTTGPDGKPLPF